MIPTVSIILPTYNRARFLPKAIESIRAQECTDWELIIVDDGSTDGTEVLLPKLTAGIPQSVRIVRQENQGPAEARNLGLEHIKGSYVAFFDSDDEWLPHHLAKCVMALDKVPDVDWVFAATRRIEFRTKQVLVDNTFHDGGKAVRFRHLKVRRDDELHVIDDPALRRCVFRGSGIGGLQASVVRRSVFSNLRFEPVYFFEDRIVIIRAVAAGVRFGYFDTVHVLVYTHEANVSFANPSSDRDRLQAFRAYVGALEEIRKELPGTFSERQALNNRIGQEYFWSIAYPLFRQGDHQDALALMRRAMGLCPWNLYFLKTYLASIVKVGLGCAPRSSTARR